MERKDAFHQIPDQVMTDSGDQGGEELESDLEFEYLSSRQSIFIVEGSTGEYSDHCEWPVAAYFSEEQAKLHVQKATERAKELIAKCDGWGWEEKQLNQWDRSMHVDYTGVNYRYYSVDLLGAVPPKGMPRVKGRTQ